MVIKMIKKKLEHFSDDRGTIVFASPRLLDFDYKYLTMGTMKPNTVRGGHYHKRIFEKLMCLSGKIVFKLDDEEIVLESGDIVDIPVGMVHTLFNNGDVEASFVEFKSEEFNLDDKDTYTRDEE